MVATITREELQEKLAGASPPVLLEALPEKYYAEGHLPGARHMPHDRTRELAPVLAPDRAAEVVVYCASQTCQNSHIAARTLDSLGYRKVSVYAGGKKDWTEAGLPVERAPAVAAE